MRLFATSVLILYLFSLCPALSCNPNEECNRCLVSAFNHCIKQGNDPICEARKAACRAGTEVGAAAGGTALEVWINQSRNTGIAGAQPVPPQIRELLIGYIEDRVLDRAKFKIGDNGILNLAGLTIKYGMLAQSQ
jgi:hypothetical protein